MNPPRASPIRNHGPHAVIHRKEIIMGRPVVHFELMSKDPAKVSDFYAKIFDWKVTDYPEMNYRVFETGGQGGINGGILKPDREGPWPGNMLFYVDVDDLGAYRKKVVAAGGKIHVEEQQVPGMGSFSLFTDPEGRMMGLWKTAPKK
jgi:predicted enzyme related to lactoylglutathione lyase